MAAELREVRPSTSTNCKVHGSTDYCSDCNRSFDVKNIIRFVLQCYHPILIVQLSIRNGDITANWAATSKVNDTSFCNYTSSVFNEEILLSFLSWLADKLNTDISRLINGIDNILTCPASFQARSPGHAIFVDFDILKLNTIGHACQALRKPLNITSLIPSRYLSCMHLVQKCTCAVLIWYVPKYFYNLDNLPVSDCDTYGRFQTVRKKIRNSLVITETDSINSQGEYVVDVLFCSGQLNSKTEQKQTPVELVNLLKNSIVQSDEESQCIVRTYDTQTTKHTFHIVYKDNSDITYDNLFKSLVFLRDILHRQRINSIVMNDLHLHCSPLNSGKIVEMIKYIFLDSHIKVIISAPRKCCLLKMICFNT